MVAQVLAVAEVQPAAFHYCQLPCFPEVQMKERAAFVRSQQGPVAWVALPCRKDCPCWFEQEYTSNLRHCCRNKASSRLPLELVKRQNNVLPYSQERLKLKCPFRDKHTAAHNQSQQSGGPNWVLTATACQHVRTWNTPLLSCSRFSPSRELCKNTQGSCDSLPGVIVEVQCIFPPAGTPAEPFVG